MGKSLVLALKGVVSHRVLHVGNQVNQFDLKFLQFGMTSQLLLLQLDLCNVLLPLLDGLDLDLAKQVARTKQFLFVAIGCHVFVGVS